MRGPGRRATDIEFLMGDARLSLEQTDRKWGLMLVDAFSSDSIPAHLLTKEAVELYFDRLTDDGLLALHISNRYLKLEPVVERIVRTSVEAAGHARLHCRDSSYSDANRSTRASSPRPGWWSAGARGLWPRSGTTTGGCP